jgi:hypothetical protein
MTKSIFEMSQEEFEKTISQMTPGERAILLIMLEDRLGN